VVKNLAEKYISKAQERMDQQADNAVKKGSKPENDFYEKSSKKTGGSEGTRPYPLTQVPKRNEWPVQHHVGISAATSVSTSRGVTLDISVINTLTGKSRELTFEPGLVFTPESLKLMGWENLYGNLSIYSAINTDSGYVGGGYRLLEGFNFGLSTKQGIGLFFGLSEQGANGLSFNAMGGPVGDPVAIVQYLTKTGTSGAGGVISFAKGVLDIGYSLGTWFSEVVAPKFKLRHKEREASQLSLYDLKSSENVSIERALDVLQSKHNSSYSDADYLGVRRHAAQHVQSTLLYEMVSGSPGLKIQHWEQLLKICDRNADLFDATFMAELRACVDAQRNSSSQATTFNAFSRMGQKSVAGAITSSFLSNIFNVQEVAIGAPINLRWHGWRIDKTIADTASGWVENTFQFENTKKAHGFFGKIGGAIMDVVGDVLKIGSRIIGTVSPIFFRSDGRKEKVRKDIMKAMEENDKFLSRSGTPDWQDKKMMENMLYLTKMLPVVFQSNDHALAKKISSHLSKNGVAYEILSSKIACAQSDQLKSTIFELDKAIKEAKDDKSRMPLRQQKAVLEQICRGAVRRAGESYVYLASLDDKAQGGMKGEAAREISSLKAFLKDQSPELFSKLDSMVKEMKDTSGIKESMETILAVMKDANGDYNVVLEKSKDDAGLKDAISTLASIRQNCGYSDVYAAFMSDLLSSDQSVRKIINESLESAIRQLDSVKDNIKEGIDISQTRLLLNDMANQMGWLSDLASFFPEEYSKDYKGKLDRELRWVMNALPNKPEKKSQEKVDAAAQRFELALVIANSGVLSPDGQSEANRQLQKLGVNLNDFNANKDGGFYAKHYYDVCIRYSKPGK
jgi:hypothetical protein